MNPELTDPFLDTAAQGISGSQIELMDLLSYIYLRHGLPEKAAVLLSARDLLSPDNRTTLLTLAIAQVRSGKPERALETLERLAMLGGIDAPFHLVRAQAFHALGRTGEAASAMKAHLALRVSLKNSPHPQ